MREKALFHQFQTEWNNGKADQGFSYDQVGIIFQALGNNHNGQYRQHQKQNMKPSVIARRLHLPVNQGKQFVDKIHHKNHS